jgi:hypothetical protein
VSITAAAEVRCEGCRAPHEVILADSVNAERHPHLRTAILERRLHTFRCDSCGAVTLIDKELLYIDLLRREFYGVSPIVELAESRAASERVAEAFELALGARAPAAARDMASGMVVRACFGLEELREKIVCRENGIFDLALEVLKAQLLANDDGARELGVWTLRLDEVGRDGRLRLVAELGGADPRVDPSLVIEVAGARYRDVANRPWRELLALAPSIASGPHVSVLRLAHVPADPPADPSQDATTTEVTR